ncbi:ATP-binding cassette domain-containing protein [Streptomyces sp. NPDC048481]|uniref:ATP-binding cassette domain-containing protein n=1 Tax=Streptomyces sp. NPDC048481 TaxID=3365557 RepID=UPI003713A72C
MDAVAVTADGLGLRGPRGWAFRDVAVEADPGSLIAVEGPSGSGRTSLLLALTGRMKTTEGTATVGGARLPKQLAAVRRVAALAHVPGVTDLEPALTVGEHVRERALLQRRFGGSLRDLLRSRADRAAEAELRIDAALDAAGLDREALPKGSRTAVRDLERVEALRLSVALALVGRPRLLGVDDVDLKLSTAERAEVWALLRSIAEAGTTVLAVCAEAPENAVVVRSGADAGRRPTPREAGPPGPRDEPGTATPQDPPETAAPQDEPDTGPRDVPGAGPQDGHRAGPKDRSQDDHEAAPRAEAEAAPKGEAAEAEAEAADVSQAGPKEQDEEESDALAQTRRA